MEKSELNLVHKVANVEELLSVLGCKVGNVLTTYIDLWDLLTNRWGCEIRWRRDSRESLPCGKNDTF